MDDDGLTPYFMIRGYLEVFDVLVGDFGGDVR